MTRRKITAALAAMLTVPAAALAQASDRKRRKSLPRVRVHDTPAVLELDDGTELLLARGPHAWRVVELADD